MPKPKPQVFKQRYKVLRAFNYLSDGREYDVETRSNSRDADFRRTDGSGIGCYVPTWELRQALNNGWLEPVEAGR